MFDTVKSLVKEISSDIPDVVIMDRAHQIGKGYNNKQQMYVVNVLQLLGTERCFIWVELIKKMLQQKIDIRSLQKQSKQLKVMIMWITSWLTLTVGWR